jgi:hypothetical protein
LSNLDLISLRISVGYLGERAQFDWWPTEFFATTSEAFLSPVFNKTAFLARYNGITTAARRLHDERVGVGRVFHLFRLPAVVEQALHEELLAEGVTETVLANTQSKDVALAFIESLADSSVSTSEGPVQIGETSDLVGVDWIARAAAYYRDAFKENNQCFPYLKDPI